MADDFTEYRFQNGAREDFVFHERRAAIVTPEHPDPSGRWAIYTEYFGAFPGVAEALLKAGYRIARLDNLTRWGLAADADARLAFADYLEAERGLAHRCVTIGMSCGGLHAIKFAGRYPDRVGCLYLDAAVLNLLSCPFALGAAERIDALAFECEQALGLSEREFLSYRDHPLDYLPHLVAARIPAVVLYGDADRTVPYSENGALLERAYREAGIPVKVIEKPGCGHHPHGLDDPTPIVDFIQKYNA